MAKKVVLAGACRTAIGKMGGALSNTPAADLGAIVIKEALNRAGVKPEMVDEVKMGCVIQAAQGQNVARQASIKAGLPIEVPAITINVVCGSGLKCVNDAATMIMAGYRCSRWYGEHVYGSLRYDKGSFRIQNEQCNNYRYNG